MRSATSCSKTLIRSDWRRFWPVVILYAVVSFFIMPVGIWNEGGTRYIVDYTLFQEQAHRTYLAASHVYETLPAFTIINLFLCLILAMTLFSYLMDTRAVGQMHALPINRTRQLLSHFGAGMSMLTAVNLLTFVVSLLLEAALGAVDVVPLLIWLLVTELVGFFFLAFATLCATVTGWLLAVPVIYFGLNFVVMAYQYILEGVSAQIWVNRGSYSGVNSLGEKVIAWLTPAMKTSDELRTPDDFGIEAYQKGATLFTANPGALTTVLVYTLVGVLMLVLACALYRARHSESAGNAIVFPWLRPVVKYVISIAAGLSLGTIAHEAIFGYENTNVIALILCMIIMGGLIYCALEMLLRKSFKILDKRTLLGLAALWLVLAAVCVCIKLDVFGREKWVPQPEQVTKVNLFVERTRISSEDPAVIRAVTELHRVLVQGDTNDISGMGFSVDYRMSNGDMAFRQLRNVDLDDPEIYQALSSLMGQPGVHFTNLLSDRGAYGENFVGGYAQNPMTGKEVQLTPEQCLALYRAMEEDAKISIKPEDLLDKDDAGLFLQLDTKLGSYCVDTIRTGNVNTMALLKEYGVLDPAE